MAQRLNQATSIVDFLKSRGFKTPVGERFPFFEQRKKLFEQIGGAEEFRGTATQNVNLLRSLSEAEKRVGVSIAPENISSILGQGAQPVTPITSPNIPDTSQLVDIPPEETFTETRTEPEVPAFLSDLARRAATSTVPSPEDLSQQAIERFTGGAEFPFAQEAVGASKEAIRLQAQRKTQDFIKNIASRGLIFSGAKTTGVEEIEVDKMTQLLGVDRSFAKLIVQGLEKSAQAIAKEAQAGQEDAIKALDKLGYVVAGDRIVQKPSETRAAAAEQRATEAGERAGRAETRAIAKAAEPDLLSPTEASTLGVPYGTTKEEAAQMGITPDRYKDAANLVPWSQWAAERGLVGRSIEEAASVAEQEAKDEKKADKERQISSVRTNIYNYIQQVRSKATTLTREQLIEQLVASHKFLSREEITTEVYGLTKELEPTSSKQSGTGRAGLGAQIKSAFELIKK